MAASTARSTWSSSFISAEQRSHSLDEIIPLLALWQEGIRNYLAAAGSCVAAVHMRKGQAVPSLEAVMYTLLQAVCLQSLALAAGHPGLLVQAQIAPRHQVQHGALHGLPAGRLHWHAQGGPGVAAECAALDCVQLICGGIPCQQPPALLSHLPYRISAISASP